MSKPKKLAPKRAAFVREYLKDFNGTQAAIRAGYSERAAKQEASRLLTNADVQSAVFDGQQKTTERAEISVERVVREYGRIAFAKIADFYDFSSAGVTMKPSGSLTEEQLAAVMEVREHKTIDAEGRATTRISLKLHQKSTALEALGRHLGMFNDKLEVRVQGELQSLLDTVRAHMTPDAYAQLAKAISIEVGEPELAPQNAAGSDSGGVIH